MESIRTYPKPQVMQQNLSKRAVKHRKRKKYPNVFFKEHMNKLFNEIDDPKTIMGAILAFFCALRIDELCSLKWNDIDLKNQILNVVDGKGGKDGFVPISPMVIPLLNKWRSINPNEKYFLPPDTGEYDHLQTKTLFGRYKTALKRAGLYIPTERTARGNMQHQYKFHTLRHSRCTHLRCNGVPIEQIRFFMRHEEIGTTMIYTWIVNPELHNMVSNIDSPQNDGKITNLQPPLTIQNPVLEDPITIAQRRLACGEIGKREFKSIVEVLSGVKA